MKKKIIYIVITILLAIILLYYFYFRSITITYQVGLGPGIHFDKIKINTKLNKPSDPTYDGYKFMGWYLNGEKYDFNAIVKNDITLVAKWEKM